MARGSDGSGGGVRLVLLVLALVVVAAAVAWLVLASDRTAAPDIDVRVPAPDVLPERSPTTPPPPIPVPSG